MARYHLSEAEITLPGTWQDQSVSSYVLPRPGGAGEGSAATLVVTRDYQGVRDLPAGGDFLERYADRQFAELARRLPTFERLGRSEASFSGRRALVVDAAWTLPDKQRVRQRQAFVRLADRVVVFTLTAREADFDQYAGVWGEVTGELRWRPGAGLPTVLPAQPAAGGGPATT